MTNIEKNNLAEIIRNIAQPVMLLDSNQKLVIWNSACEALFGWDESEVIGGNDPSVSTEDIEEYKKELSALYRGDVLRDIKVKRRDKQGKSFEIMLSCIPVFDNTSPAYIICIYDTNTLDIKWVIEKLMKISSDFEHYCSLLDEVLVEFNEEKIITFISPKISSLIENSTPVQYIDKEMDILFTDLGLSEKQIVDIKKQYLLNLTSSRNILELPFTVGAKSNRKDLIIKLKFIYDDTGKMNFAIGYIKNDTALKTVKEFDNVITTSSLELMKNFNDTILYASSERDVNFSSSEIFGYKQDDLKSFPCIFENIVSGEDKNLYKDFFNEFVKDGKPNETRKIQYRIKDKKGGEIWLEEEVNKNILESGKPFFISIVKNVTSYKQTEENLIIEKNEALEISKLKYRFLSKINLELRTPITSILGLADILREEVKSASAIEKVEQIQKSGSRFMQAVNSIINLYLLELSKYELNLNLIKINSILEDMVSNFSQQVAIKNLFLRYEADKNLIAVADEKLLKGILNNIIDNAILYTHTGGIKISGANVELDGKHYCDISVVDTGIGMSKEKFESIFNEPENGKDQFNINSTSAGLGLAVAKKMAELMKGKILLSSVPGRGSTFTLRLPSRYFSNKDIFPSDEKPGKIIEKRFELGKKEKPTVLLVEDNLTNKIITVLFLKDICDVEHAINGTSAIDMCEKKDYDLVLMDINLGPGINGIETTERIKKINSYENVPFIAVTGYAMPGDEEKLLHLGFDKYLAKPFKKEQISQLVKNLLKIN